MNRVTVVLVVVAFLLIGGLPRLFFRQGRLNLMWWVTAWPFFACPALLLAFFFGWLPAPPWLGRLFPAQDMVATLPALAAMGLLFFTLGSHRIPIALWHQQEDAPREIVTWGAYARIRHPFYASFLLAFLSAILCFPHPAVVALFAYSAIVLDRTAAREERRLSASHLGEQYRAYMQRTGRFFPRLRSHPEGEQA